MLERICTCIGSFSFRDKERFYSIEEVINHFGILVLRGSVLLHVPQEVVQQRQEDVDGQNSHDQEIYEDEGGPSHTVSRYYVCQRKFPQQTRQLRSKTYHHGWVFKQLGKQQVCSDGEGQEYDEKYETEAK